MWHARGNGTSVFRREVRVLVRNFDAVDDFDLRVNPSGSSRRRFLRILYDSEVFH